jgi:hypothetical protein
MLYLLSPAKTLDFETRVPAVVARNQGAKSASLMPRRRCGSTRSRTSHIPRCSMAVAARTAWCQ